MTVQYNHKRNQKKKKMCNLTNSKKLAKNIMYVFKIEKVSFEFN